MEKKKSLKMFTAMLIIAVFCAFVMPSFMLDSQAYAASKTHLSKSSISLYTGDTQKINLILPSGKKVSASKITWKSSSSKIASVKKGKITGKSEGKCTITAKYKGKKYKCKVEVKNSYAQIKENYSKNTPEENMKVLAGMVQDAGGSFSRSDTVSSGTSLPSMVVNSFIEYSSTYRDLTFRVTYSYVGSETEVSAVYHLDTQKWTTIKYSLTGQMQAQMHTTENFDPSTYYSNKILTFAFDNNTPVVGLKSPALETASNLANLSTNMLWSYTRTLIFIYSVGTMEMRYLGFDNL